MMNYTGLQYKTRGNVSPQGRPRIYFCCHEADFVQTFGLITEEILKITTYAVFWYYDPANGIPDGELFFSDLSLMQLFVIPVTKRFLGQDCRARSVELQYAIDHHIPVLPLMLEPGLERDFNQMCGDLQLLDRRAGLNDPTEIPYKERLTKFLGEVLITNELAKMVKAAFDTYIFLSYRKKDRIYAQQIMRQIHASESCQDIAIWYDEFLIPGENFNDSIADVMDKCDLLALVVTPNLLEDSNYIMTTEYPLFKQSGKPIVPIEALATDNEKLSRLYKGIRSPLPPDLAIMQMSGMISNDTTRINETVRNKTSKINYADYIALHNFLIGLAYLYGIEVEVDKDHALKLILSSAEAGCLSACKKLVAMYINGEGVGHSYESAIIWQKQLVDLLQDIYDEDPTEDNRKYLVPEIRILSVLYLAAGDTASAEETNTYMLKYMVLSQSSEAPETLRSKALYYKNLGDIRREQDKSDEAVSWYMKSLALRETLVQQSQAPPDFRDLAACYTDLGDVNHGQGLLDEAETYYQKALVFRKLLAKKADPLQNDWNPGITQEKLKQYTGTVQDRRNLTACCNQLGRICKAQGRLDEAQRWYRQSLMIMEALAEETWILEDRRAVSVSCNHLGKISKAQGRMEEARTWFLKSLKMMEPIAEETESAIAYRNLAAIYKSLHNICAAQGKEDEAQEWHQKWLLTKSKKGNKKINFSS